ncbi:MAG: hypothetical protein ABR583_08300 [Gaiellaceae bacterium]
MSDQPHEKKPDDEPDVEAHRKPIDWQAGDDDPEDFEKVRREDREES